MDYIMTTDGLTKMYGEKAAAKDINIHIRPGAVYGLIGRNGAGKTTVMTNAQRIVDTDKRLVLDVRKKRKGCIKGNAQRRRSDRTSRHLS